MSAICIKWDKGKLDVTHLIRTSIGHNHTDSIYAAVVVRGDNDALSDTPCQALAVVCVVQAGRTTPRAPCRIGSFTHNSDGAIKLLGRFRSLWLTELDFHLLSLRGNFGVYAHLGSLFEKYQYTLQWIQDANLIGHPEWMYQRRRVQLNFTLIFGFVRLPTWDCR